MAVGLDLDTEYMRRSSIPSGGAGTLTGGGFSDFFAGVWVYRPSATATYALTASGFIIHGQASAREIGIGFNSAGSNLSDLNLQMVYNSGGGTGTPYLFPLHTGTDFLDEWMYYFMYEDASNNLVAGYIQYSNLSVAVTNSYANDNAGSQYINTLTFGNDAGAGGVVIGHYAYARARDSAASSANVLTYANSDATISGDWGFWDLDTNSDTADTSGNSRTLTFNGTLTTETSPTFGGGGVSGTLAKTNTNDTAAISGTTTVLGTLARTNVNDGRTISGTTTVVGSVARTNGNDTAAIAGSVGSPVAGTLAKTDVADGMAGAGTTTILSTLARTNSNDTMTAAGSVTILGTLARTNVNDTMVANGSSGTAVYGTLARTNIDDTTVAAGTTTILGSLARTNTNDVMVGAGTTTLLGTLARTNRNDTSAIFGISGTPSIALQIWNKLTIAKRNSL